MSVAAAFSYAPVSVGSQFKPNKAHKGFLLNLEFSGRTYVFLGTRIHKPNIVSSSMRTRAGTGDEGIRIGAFEQEAFINGYSNSAPAGLQATLNNLSKWLVTAFFGAILLWRHDAEALWAALGSVVNAGLSHILKRILNQERPVSTLRSDPGMPSSHAQSIFYTVNFAILSITEWFGLNGYTTAVSGLLFALGSYFSWLRVLQQLHTISQVLVGAALGSIFSVIWFWSWNSVIFNAFVAHLWVRIIVVLAAVGFCLGFLLYIIRYWIIDKLDEH